MKDKMLLNGKVVVVEIADIGEGVTLCHTICAEKLKAFLSENILDDTEMLMDGLGETPIVIKTMTVDESRESEIRGTMWGEGCSRESAIRIVDGLEPLSEEQEEAALEKQIAEAMK